MMEEPLVNDSGDGESCRRQRRKLWMVTSREKEAVNGDIGGRGSFRYVGQ